MAIIIVLLLILGSAAFLYFKGTIVRSFAAIISAIFACVAAFAFFESLASILIGRGTMVPWAYTVSFLLLFVLTFAILFALTLTLTRWPVDFGSLPEKIGRVVCGIILGFILSGAVLTALAMAPLSPKSPYQRFDPANPDIDKPRRLIAELRRLRNRTIQLRKLRQPQRQNRFLSPASEVPEPAISQPHRRQHPARHFFQCARNTVQGRRLARAGKSKNRRR